MCEWFGKKAFRLICGVLALGIFIGYLPGLAALAAGAPAGAAQALKKAGAPLLLEEMPAAGSAPHISIQNPGEGEGTELGEEATPTAGPGGHRCCILHFILLLAAFVLELLDLSCAKKGQRDIFEARAKLKSYHPQGR